MKKRFKELFVVNSTKSQGQLEELGQDKFQSRNLSQVDSIVDSPFIQKGLKNTKLNFVKPEEVEIIVGLMGHIPPSNAENIEEKMDLVPRIEDLEIDDETRTVGIFKNQPTGEYEILNPSIYHKPENIFDNEKMMESFGNVSKVIDDDEGIVNHH